MYYNISTCILKYHIKTAYNSPFNNPPPPGCLVDLNLDVCTCACVRACVHASKQTYPPTNTKVVSDVDLCTVSFDDTGVIRSHTFGLMVELIYAIEDPVRHIKYQKRTKAPRG